MNQRLGEFERIKRFFRPLAKNFIGAFELSDDAAVIAAPPGHELVVTTDALVAGVHFLPDDPPGDIARKLLRVNLSDLAAKGAAPLAYCLVTSLPRDLDEGWVAAFADGLAADQDLFGIQLAGGDSVSTPGPMTFSVTAFGLVPVGGMIQRRGKRREDPLFVTGTIGDAALGLRILQGKLELPPSDAAYLIDRYRIPRPRVAMAAGFRDFAESALDVSDGLVADCGHLCDASENGAVIEASAVPLSAPARAALERDPDLLNVVLTGGDDYEILFTARPNQRANIQAAAERQGVPIAEIGRMTGHAGSVTVLDRSRTPLNLVGKGWQHF